MEKLLRSQTIYTGRILTLKKVTVELQDGRIGTREIIKHHKAAVILPVQDNHVYLIKQYRIAIQKTIIEAPAGVLNKNETPLKGAKRELKEETGLIAKKWTPLGKSYPVPGYSNEFMHFFLAENLTVEAQNLDDDEQIEVIQMPLAKMESAITKHQIIDGKTIQAYLLFKQSYK